MPRRGGATNGAGPKSRKPTVSEADTIVLEEEESPPPKISTSRTPRAAASSKKVQYQDLELTSDSEDEDTADGKKKSVNNKGKSPGVKLPKKAPATPAAAAAAAKKLKKGDDEDEADPEEDEDFEDEDDYEDDEAPKKKGRGGKKGGVRAKAPPKKKRGKKGGGEDGEGDEREEESEPSDGEDENEDKEAAKKIDYKNDDWFEKVTKTCQICKELFPTCRDASLCVTGKHRRLRCYLCYNYYRNTETLFKHYEDAHRVSTCKKEQLLCPFCSQSVPFKSASCHVITSHVAPREAKQEGKTIDGESVKATNGKGKPGPQSKGAAAAAAGGKRKAQDSDEEDEEEESDDDDEMDDSQNSKSQIQDGKSQDDDESGEEEDDDEEEEDDDDEEEEASPKKKAKIN